MLTPKTVLVALGACAAIWAGSVESSFAGESPFVLAFYQAEHPEQDPGTLRTPPVACPDTSTFQFNNTISGASPSLAASSANGGLPTCGAYVIQSAIDLCLEHSARTSVFDQWGQWFSQGSAVLAGLATGIAAAVGTSGTSLAAVGVGTLLLTNGGTAVGKILPSAPPQPQVQSMITAGIEYVVLNSQATPTMTTYAGLWNAVGSACPAGQFSEVNASTAGAQFAAYSTKMGHPVVAAPMILAPPIQPPSAPKTSQ